MAILISLLLLWIAIGFGLTVMRIVKALPESGYCNYAFAGAIGFGFAAYAVLIVGLLHQLYLLPILLIWALMVLVGYKGMQTVASTLVNLIRRFKSAWKAVSVSAPGARIGALGVVALLTFGGAALLACYKPPGGVEWDAISYHLADPRQFLMQHSITSLPTEHHSNFPLLMEMLYTVGLLFSGFVLANMLHWLMAALTTAAIFGFLKSRVGSFAAWSGVVLFITTPVVLWEAGVAYVELGLALYTTLAVLAAVSSLQRDVAATDRTAWLRLSAIAIGFALGVKYLALIPLFLIILLLLFRRQPFVSIIKYAALAILIGCPWYVKSAVITHNPVYPFMYRAFPGSIYWSANRAAGYESEQSHFGTFHSLKQPQVAIRNLIQVPWDLLTLPNEEKGTYSNPGEFSFMTLIGGLYVAFTAGLLLRRRMDRQIADLLLLGTLQVGAWFMVAQVSRYLVSVLPLLAITAAAGLHAIQLSAARLASASKRRLAVVLLGASLLLLFAQASGSLYSLVYAPSGASPMSLPAIVDIMREDHGASGYLKKHLDTFAAVDWINHRSVSGDKVLIYDDTKGYYLERPYMWANEEHSGYIPYAKFVDGAQLTDWMVKNHYRYAMFNLNWAPQNTDPAHPDPDLPGGPNGNELLAFTKWYASVPLKPVGSPGYRWRGLVADALRRGLWTDVGASQHGVVVVRIGGEPISFKVPTPAVVPGGVD